MRARDNPFAADRVLRLRYRLAEHDWSLLLDRLERLRYRAALVGPEGHGKTTLLEDLEERLVADGRFDAARLCLRRGAHRFSAWLARHRTSLTPRTLIFVDGAEQMSGAAWNWFRWRTRPAAGIVITTHKPGRLPTAWTCETTPALFEDLVRELVGEEMEPWRDELPALFTRHAGNLRHALRELYDRYAAQGPRASHIRVGTTGFSAT